MKTYWLYCFYRYVRRKRVGVIVVVAPNADEARAVKDSETAQPDKWVMDEGPAVSVWSDRSFVYARVDP